MKILPESPRQGDRSTCFCFLIAALLIAGALCKAAPEAGTKKAHSWTRIDYPQLPIPGAGGEKMTIFVGSGDDDETPLFRFDIVWSARSGTPLPANLADEKIAVRLHLPGGAVIQPKHWPADGEIISNAGGDSHDYMYSFPWTANKLEEAWVELALPGQTYWIEVPYGFTRNPKDPVPPADPAKGNPEFPPAMNPLPKSDLLVPWLGVLYELGEIQNHWRLSAYMSNPLDADAKVILYREDFRGNQTFPLWKMNTPKTSIVIARAEKESLKSTCTDIHISPEIGMERTDTFHFNTDPSPAEGREWGTAVIRVDDKKYEFPVPSSLFEHGHGISDPANQQRLPR